MQIYLAGYNIDAEVIAELTKGETRSDVTPETLSAAYARISRDPRPVDELRKIARQEVEKARKSNSNIIFKMGHHSVAEHAVFNFDLIGVSRLALEEVEKFRLCSYTEKSQRYQKLEGNFIVPSEIKNAGFEQPFLALVSKQNAFYQKMVENGIEPEDARYITSLSTTGQLGMTINARNLEYLVRRFASSHLEEVRAIGEKMYALAAKVAPSIILFTAANDFDQNTYQEVRQYFRGKWERKRRTGQEVELVDVSAGADIKLVAALLHSSSEISYRNCLRTVKAMSKKEREKAVRAACQKMEFYDAVLREFEHINLTYDVVMSSGCFAQMKRHRMATITSQLYEPELGATLPPKIAKDAGLKKDFLEIISDTNVLFNEVKKGNALVAQYVLTSAHRKRSLMTLNARELYHISRLREDPHAQWDIQNISAKMSAAAKKTIPLAMLLIGGKDSYADLYEKIFGAKPKILPPKE
ncbi:MAG: FAD-dependent thymidylate synthase [Candidatus Margulisiibacteriota bacterium]